MVTNPIRRNLLKAALLGVASPAVFAAGATSAAARKPALIGCALAGRERFQVVVADSNGMPLKRLPLPARGHGIAVSPHPHAPLAVAFARRPGDYFQPFDYQTGAALPLVAAARGRHFYGHGAFSNDGRFLYVSEGDKQSRGIVGVYDAEAGFSKVQEFAGFGIGPHELIVRQDNSLVIAVGGVHTSGRTPLNLDSMQPALVYLGPDGALLEKVGLGNKRLSIRHLARGAGNYVVCGQQYRGEPDDYPPLIALHKRGGQLQQLKAEPEQWARFNQYIASIAIDGDYLLATSPRGNCYGIWSLRQNRLLELAALPDASGVVANRAGFVISSGSGRCVVRRATENPRSSASGVVWDNHWTAIPHSFDTDS